MSETVSQPTRDLRLSPKTNSIFETDPVLKKIADVAVFTSPFKTIVAHSVNPFDHRTTRTCLVTPDPDVRLIPAGSAYKSLLALHIHTSGILRPATIPKGETEAAWIIWKNFFNLCCTYKDSERRDQAMKMIALAIFGMYKDSPSVIGAVVSYNKNRVVTDADFVLLR